MSFPIFTDATERANRGRPSNAWLLAKGKLSGRPLFAVLKGETCTDIQTFVRAVNSLTMINKFSDLEHQKLPADLSDSFSTSGASHWSVELLHFGNWLLVDGKPGASKVAGKPADDMIVFRTIAAALSERFARQKTKSSAAIAVAGSIKSPKVKTVASTITRLDLSKRYEKLFVEKVPADKFKPRLKTAALILTDYINYLANKQKAHSGSKPTRSKELEGVLKAISAADARESKSQSQSRAAPKTSRAASVPPVVSPVAHAAPQHVFSAKPSVRIVPLEYSSEAKCAEYRAGGSALLPQTTLSYDVLPADAYGTSDQAIRQKRFAGKVVFVPDFTLKDNIRVKAVIDRMIICFVTMKVTSAQHVQSEVAKLTGANCFVQDLNSSRGEIAWAGHIALPPESAGVTDNGRVFAILIQEPTPVVIGQTAQLISSRWGTVGLMRPFLLELALDFHVQRTHDLQTRTALREKMVGLIQRHHRCIDAGLVNAESDARQVYEGQDATGGIQTKTNFLFPKLQGASRKHSDKDVASEDVKNRIERPLTNTLWLDATIYAGRENENLLFRTQHKISDKRNKNTNTFTSLNEEDRRARVEVEISGYEKLGSDLGLNSIADLKGFSFRKVRKSHLSFWLPTAPSDIAAKEVAYEQLKQRGIYGVEIMQSVARYKNQKADVSAGRQSLGGTGSLVAWKECNERVGDALDALRKRWNAFEA